MAIVKSKLLKELSDTYPNFLKKDLERFFDCFLDEIKNALNRGERVEIRGFGTISRKLNKEKYVRNPKTNEKLFKKQSYKLHFKISKNLHKRLNSEKKDED